MSYLSMLGLSLCQYVGVKMPHKQQGLVTRKTTATSLAIIVSMSLLIPVLLILGVSPSLVEKLQLHLAFQLSNVLLCAVYLTLGKEYLRQVKRAMDNIKSIFKLCSSQRQTFHQGQPVVASVSYSSQIT